MRYVVDAYLVTDKGRSGSIPTVTTSHAVACRALAAVIANEMNADIGVEGDERIATLVVVQDGWVLSYPGLAHGEIEPEWVTTMRDVVTHLTPRE
jgi:hypothetical protein